MTTDLAATRPAAHLISFAPECFAQDGETVTYAVSRSSIHSGPAIFSRREDAEDLSRRTGRPVVERRAPRMVRVRWY